MSRLSVCPSAPVAAPVDRVWDLLTRPEGFHLWAEAVVVAAEPEGYARPGQLVHVVTRALGWSFAGTIEVREVDPERRRLRFVVELPFGVVGDEEMTVTAAGDRETLVQFGGDFSFPPGWRGGVVRILLGRGLRRGPASSLARLKRTAEAPV